MAINQEKNKKNYFLYNLSLKIYFLTKQTIGIKYIKNKFLFLYQKTYMFLSLTMSLFMMVLFGHCLAWVWICWSDSNEYHLRLMRLRVKPAMTRLFCHCIVAVSFIYLLAMICYLYHVLPLSKFFAKLYKV